MTRAGAVSAVMLCGAALLTGCSTEQTEPAAVRDATPVLSPAPLPTAPATAADQLDDGSTSSPRPARTLAADEQAKKDAAAAADAVMQLFARRDVDADTWWQDLSPLLSAKAAQDYRYTDPANVPPARVTGAAKALPQETPTVARVSVPTDAGVYLVVLSRTQAQPRWVVERITPPEGSGD